MIAPATALVSAGLALVTLAGCAPAPLPSEVGRLYHYVRSNDDGTLPEDIYVYREAETRVAVHKAVSRCTNAAYVTAELDPARGEARGLVGGRLARDHSQEAFAWLTFDAASRALEVSGGGLDESLRVGTAPWRLYDFDLADIGALDRDRALARTDFRSSIALVWPAPGATQVLQNRGEAVFRFAAAEDHDGTAAVRYDVSGALNGRIWFEARRGHVVGARFAEPNHTEYTNFRLELREVTEAGRDAWTRALASHWQGCPPPGA